MEGLSSSDIKNIVEKIRGSVIFFANFEASELIEILKASTIKKVKNGEIIFKKDEPGDEMYIIVYGSVSISKGGRELAKLGPGACFGEMGIIDRFPRTADAKTVEDSLLMLVSEDILDSTDMGVRLKLYKNFAHVLAQRLRATNQEIGT